jgi:hypothetical protein
MDIGSVTTVCGAASIQPHPSAALSLVLRLRVGVLPTRVLPQAGRRRPIGAST